jgi:hypothetical protein
MVDKESMERVIAGLVQMFKDPHDAIFFSEYDKTPTTKGFRIEQWSYNDPGERISGAMGDIYHIFFLEHNYTTKEPEMVHFEAALIDPLTYIKRLIQDGISGGVARKTTTSQEAVVDALLNGANLNNIRTKP